MLGLLLRVAASAQGKVYCLGLALVLSVRAGFQG